MQQVELPLPAALALPAIEAQIEATIAELGLRTTMRDTLKQYPGCIHWHIKQGSAAGTLEVTLWPGERRAWLSIHHNRSTAWVVAMMPVFAATLQRRLSE